MTYELFLVHEHALNEPNWRKHMIFLLDRYKLSGRVYFL